MIRFHFLFLFSFFLGFPIIPPAFAAAPQLILPAACTPGTDCWVVNHVDMNPEKASGQDFTCGPRAYDGHEGTDFGLKDRQSIMNGVSVLAAAPGKVLRVRDAMPDAQPTQEQIDRYLADNKGCGNGVLVDHGDGWQSIYCHLKSGSIVVKPDDSVTAGQKLAEIGQSGAAEFPHVHFGLFQNNRTVDPFSGAYADEGCGKVKGPMWLYGISLDYEPLAIFVTGFETGVPDFEKIKDDSTSPEQVEPAVPALTFWTGLYGMNPGDEIVLRITAPDGSVFAENTITQKDPKSRQFYYIGKRVTGSLQTGPYKGSVTVSRAIPGSEEKLTRNAEKILRVIAPVERPSQDASNGTMLP
jgi:murein DD-endopeptidase MepM/ murein hydrolase activator NlpD